MQRRKIIPVLFLVLIAAAIFLGVYFFVMYRSINYLPEEALHDLCGILEDSDISLNKEIVPLKKETGTVFVCDSKDYSARTAEQLGENEIQYRFAVPEGEIIVLQNGARCEFKSGFRFRYCEDYSKGILDESWDDTQLSSMRLLSGHEIKEVREAAIAFLEKGSRDFNKETKLNIATETRNCYEKDGIYYLECFRSVDGAEIAGNKVLCLVRDGTVIEAEGVWCFLTLGDTYYSQLTDILNILFSVKKEIEEFRESEDVGRVTIQSIERCEILYYADGNVGLCFLPCWKIETDVCGTFLFNAIDGSLFTE